jgi:hypothetical protein
MSPERRPTGWFGRTFAQAARGALILALLGCGAILSVERYLIRQNTPIGELFHATGLPPAAPLILGVGSVLAIALGATWTSVRTAPRFRITEQGLEIEGSLGHYRLAWDNVRAVGTSPSGALGLRVEDRDAVLATHQGTTQQREWLRTMEPYGEWDFLFQRAELGRPAAEVLEWIREVRAG